MPISLFYLTIFFFLDLCHRLEVHCRMFASRSNDLDSIPGWDNLDYFCFPTMNSVNPPNDCPFINSSLHVIHLLRNSEKNIKIEGVNVTGSKYINPITNLW